jgi:hypothetical protein
MPFDFEQFSHQKLSKALTFNVFLQIAFQFAVANLLYFPTFLTGLTHARDRRIPSKTVQIDPVP